MLRINFLILCIFFCVGSVAIDCKDLFGSRLHFETKAVVNAREDNKIHPRFFNVGKERELIKKWNQRVPAGYLEMLFPKDVHFVNHQLHLPDHPTSIKIGQPGSAIMARAHYRYDGKDLATNVVFSTRVLVQNKKAIDDFVKSGDPSLTLPKQWLVGEDANAAILFLHGGGTKSATAHTATSMVSHFNSFKIDVLSLDLPWHGEGHREFFGKFEKDIEVLSAFVKKFVPPNVPLFVWGHSWGATFAEKIMRMDHKNSDFSFHKNLKGLMIMSPPVDPAPGKSFKEKFESSLQPGELIKDHQEKFAENERDIFNNIVQDGKISPLGGFYSRWTMLQNDQMLPEHRGKNYVPSLMVVGKGDPLVYVGYEKFFNDFYRNMDNIDVHILEKYPLATNPKGKEYLVGHLLGDYAVEDPVSGTHKSIYYSLAHNFIKSVMGWNKMPNQNNQYTEFIKMIQMYSHDLAFREFVQSYDHFLSSKTHNFNQINKVVQTPFNKVRELIHPFVSKLAQIEFYLINFSKAQNQNQYRKILKQLQDFVEGFEGRPENKKLFEDIQLFKKDTPIQKVHQFSKELLRKYTFPTSKKSKVINSISRSTSFKDAMEIIDEKAPDLPPDRRAEVISLVLEYFEIQNIKNENYAPSFEKIQERSSKIKDKKKLKERLKLIESNVKERKKLREISNELSQKYRVFSEEMQGNFDDVRHNIRLIKEALIEAPSRGVESLDSEIKASEKELEKVIELSNTMTELIEGLSVSILGGNKEMSVSEVNDLLLKHKENIDHFTKSYERYVLFWKNLKQKMVVAIEKGEMGDKYKKAVINIYGVGSKGDQPIHSVPSLYNSLEAKINKLAEIESENYHNSKRIGESLINYQDLWNHVLNQVEFEEPGNIMTFTPNISINGIYSVADVFKLNETFNNQDPQSLEDFLNHLQLHSSEIKDTYKTWQDLTSSLPPFLPTSEN